MKSSIAGGLRPTEYDPEFYESEPFEIPYFDNKKLKIGFIEAKYQPYLDGADQALQRFTTLTSSERLKDSEIVTHYYKQTLQFGHTNPLAMLTSHDIWNYIIPKEIIIHWDDNGDFYVCVSCECEWEEEHGLQLVFREGATLTRASGHDGHFED